MAIRIMLPIPLILAIVGIPLLLLLALGTLIPMLIIICNSHFCLFFVVYNFLII